MAESRGGRVRSETARRSILDATRTLLAEQGYDRLTIDGIVAEAGVGKQTVYRWWPSKSAIVAECFGGDLFVDASVPDTGDLRADLGAWLEALARYGSEPANSGLLRGLIAAAADSTDVADRLYAQLTAGVETSLTRRLSTSTNTNGAWAVTRARPAAAALIGSFVYGILVNRPLNPQATAELADLVVRGLSSP